MSWSWDTLYFQWPHALWLFLVLPVFVVAYRFYQAKQWDAAFRYSPLSVVEHLKLNPSPWKRVFYPVMILILMSLLILGLARPTVVNQVPVRQLKMMLVLDISLSMMADDIAPSRLEAAKKAAVDFVDSLPSDVSIGLELFAGNNYVVQPPTRDHSVITAYLKTLSERHLQLRTEIGSALKTAEDLLTSEARLPGVQETDEMGLAEDDGESRPQQVIILLSDGDSQEGYPWNVAAGYARDHNIIVHTVGIGGEGEASIMYQGQRYPVHFNEGLLRQISKITGGEYFRVFSSEDFSRVYEQVKQRTVVYQEKEEELSWLLSGMALVMLIWSLAISALWLRRL